MAKKSAINKNERRRKTVKRDADKRARLRALARDRSLPPEERFQAYLKLAELPRDGAAVGGPDPGPNSGRPRGNYRKFKLSRIALRDLASIGQIPGMVKSSW